MQVSGLLDPVLVDFVHDSVRDAVGHRAEALVIQLNSGGAVGSSRPVERLATMVVRSPVPVAVWVGPAGAVAYGAAARLLRASPLPGAAPATGIGRLARRVHLLRAATLGDFIVGLNGRAVHGRRLETAEVVRTSHGPRQRPTVQVSFAKPALVPRLLHTVAGPGVAFFLLVAGLLLVVLDFFTGGIGVSGVVGAIALVLAAYGLGVLPTRAWALALLGFGVFGFSVDVQVGAPRVWTAIGAACTVLGAANLYAGLSPGIVVIVLVLVGVALFMVGGMPALVRARYSTPTIGRDSLIGETGTAFLALSPEGTVRVRGGLWRARTNRATPIAAGDTVKVTGIEGLVLEVEPARAGEDRARSR